MKNNITISNMSTRKIFAVHRTITTDPLITKHAGFIAGSDKTHNLEQAIFHEKMSLK